MYISQCARCGVRYIGFSHKITCPGCGLTLILNSKASAKTVGCKKLRSRLYALYIFFRFKIFKCCGNVEYELKQLLGQNAIAKVYLAKNSIGKMVVVKIFSHYRYFTLEISPDNDVNTVKIVDRFAVGESAKIWRRVLVTEYMPGGSLAERIKRQHCYTPLQAICEVIVPLCLVLQHIHSCGRVHKHLTLTNIFFDSQGKIKVDVYEDELGEDISLYSAAYLSPEQCQGTKVTPSTDIYALGCIFFELLTGSKVFERSTIEEYRSCHINFPAPRPDIVNNRLPIEISEVLLKTLAKKSEDRYANVEEILRAVLPELIAVAKRNDKHAHQALETLVSIGAIAVPRLISVLKSHSWEEKSPVIKILKNIASQSISQLISVLKYINNHKHMIKILELVCSDTKSTIVALAGALQAKDRDTRLVAAQLLTSAGANAATVVEDITIALEDKDIFVRFAVIEALGAIGAKASSAVPRLIYMLDDPLPFVRFAAAQALGNIGSDAQEALPALARSRKDCDMLVCFNAARAIDRIKPVTSFFFERQSVLAKYWEEKTMQAIDPKTRETKLAVQAASRENEWSICYYALETIQFWLSHKS